MHSLKKRKNKALTEIYDPSGEMISALKLIKDIMSTLLFRAKLHSKKTRAMG